MVETHEAEKTFKCEVCGKMFLLAWRLRKHTDIHEGLSKMCHFFTNNRPCPFYEIGCKFLHADENNEHLDDIETVEDEISQNGNQCHLCGLKLTSRNDMMDHVENNHVEYFQGIMEISERNRTEV